MKNTVLFVVNNLNKQGPNRQLELLLCNILPRVNARLVVFGRADADVLERVRLAGVPVTVKTLTGVLSPVRASLTLRRLIQALEVDLIHTSGFRADLACALTGFRPTVQVIRNIHFVNWRHAKGKFWGTVFGYIHFLTILMNRNTVACSDAVREHLLNHGIYSRVITNAVRMPFRGFAPRKLRHSGSSKFLTVGSAIPGKNVEFLIDVFSSADELRDAQLTIIGDVSEELRARARSFRNIVFCGHIEDPHKLFVDADYFVSASTHEGMPNAVLEAIAYSLPLILSDIPPHLHILNSSHGIGTAFNNNSRGSFLEAIARARAIASNNDMSAFQQAYQAFSVDRMVAQYCDLYELLLREKRGRNR